MNRWMHVPHDWRRADSGESYDLFWDDGAAYGQLLPRPDPGRIPSFYDVEDYYTHGASKDAAPLPSPVPAPVPSLADRALLHLAWRFDHGVEPGRDWWDTALGPAPLSILEIGCGNGANMQMMRDLGHDATGLEPDGAAAREALSRGLDVTAGVAEDLPAEVRSRRFDAVVMMHVLEHCLDPHAALASAASVLREGGALIVEVPNNACRGASFFRESWYWLDVPRHLNFFTERSLRDTVARAGFSVVRADYRGYVRQFDVPWRAKQRAIRSLMGTPAAWRTGVLGAWTHLALTAAARPARKYDSIRLVCRRAPARTAGSDSAP